MIRSLRTYSYILGWPLVIRGRLARLRANKQEMDGAAYDAAVHEVARAWACGILKRAGVQLDVQGLDRLPEGPVLLLGSHAGNFDIPVLLAALPKPFGFLSKKEVQKIPFIPDWMEEMNCVFVDRSSRKGAVASIYDTAAALRSGHSILIFPEGTRSRDGSVAPFKTGFYRIAKEARATIVPLAISGTQAIMENNGNWIRPARVQVEVLAPLPFEELERLTKEEAAADLRARIASARERQTAALS